MNDAGRTMSVARARRSLQVARDNLDHAVRFLPEREGDSVMATPALLGLLLHAVTARRHLSDLEIALARDPWP
jgi:hypothetical protein